MLKSLKNCAILLLVLGVFLSSEIAATTSQTAVSAVSYTQIGSAASAEFVTVWRDSQYCFSATQPSATTVCHKAPANTVIPVCALQSGLKLWVKSDTYDSVAVATQSTDASLFCSSSGGGGGDATAANQVVGNAILSSIDGKLPALVSSRVPVDGSGVTQPISVSALPLPSGASTSALQSTGNTALTTINTTLGSPLQAGGSVVVTSAPTTAVTNSGLSNIDVALSTRLKPSDTLAGITTVGAVTAITNALPSGTNLLGKTGIDQTTPGTTNKVNIGTDGTVAATQSGSWSFSLPSGASTESKQNDTISAISDLNDTVGNLSSSFNDYYSGSSTSQLNIQRMGGQNIDLDVGSSGSGTQRVVLASDQTLNLPSGASTSAKQPALGTAGSASVDVITVQGIASMTALKTDGSGVTQPVSGTVTANIGTSGSLALNTAVTGLQVTQSSSTSGQSGTLVQGAVTTAAPSYTNSQTSPLSLDGSGNLRVITSTAGTSATAANQSTEIASLASIATQTSTFPYLSTAGQGSVGVVASAASNCSSGTAGCNMLSATNVPWTDTRGYGMLIVKVVSSTNTGAYTVETADDASGTNIMTQTCYYYGQSLANAQASFPVTLTSSANYRLFCPIQNGFTRVRITTTTGASSSYSLYASNMPSPYVSSQQFGAWSFGTIPVATVAAANSPLNSTSTAYEASRVVKASAGIVYSIACYNSKASAQWVLLFNSTTVPADSTVTNAVPIYCQATSNCSADYGNYGKYFSTGVSWSNSSTSPTKTIGSADVFCDVRYQ